MKEALSTENARKVGELMRQIQTLEGKLESMKVQEDARFQGAWLNIKNAQRVADEEKLQHRRTWDIGAKEADAAWQAYKQSRLEGKRLAAEYKLTKAKLKNAQQQAALNQRKSAIA